MPLVEEPFRRSQFKRDRSHPLRAVLVAAGVVLLVEFIVLAVFFLPRRNPPASRRIPFDEIWRARMALAPGRDPAEAVSWGEAALAERGSDAGVHAVVGEAYLKMNRVEQARHHLYMATISPGSDADRAHARDLLESLYTRSGK